MAKKTALITGISGQDGAYLAEFLLKKKYKIIGTDRRSARGNNWRLNRLGILNKILYEEMELSELYEIERIFRKYKIDEVYNLAAQSFVATSFKSPLNTSNITGLGVLRILETIKNINKKIKFYQASSSEMFGYESDIPFNELSIFKPNTTYAKTKYVLHKKSIEFQRTYNWKIVSGIMFNHESEFRTTNFLIMKLIDNAIENQLGKNKKIEIPSLDISRDWSYAKDICDGIFNLTFNNFFGSYVLGSGKITSLKDISKYIYEKLNLNYLDFVTINKNKLRSGEPLKVMSNPEKIKNDIGWKTKLNIYETIDKMFSYKLNDKN